MADEWGPWIAHDGMGMPCAPYEIVHTVDRSGEEQICRADDPLNVCENGSSWEWMPIDLLGVEIIRYRIRKPRGMVICEQLLADLPERVDA